jgi:hypothetical protein
MLPGLSSPSGTLLLSSDRAMEKHPPSPCSVPLQSVAQDISKIKAIKECLKWGGRPCGRALCPRCGAAREQRRASRARDIVRDQGTVLALHLTIAHVHSLDGTWTGSERTWSQLTRRGRLTERVDGYVRFTGISLREHWHPHFHVLLVSRIKLKPEQTGALADWVTTRWASSASHLGYLALPQGQDAAETRSATGYASYSAGQAWRAGSGGSMTPRDVLAALAYTGDGAFEDAWHEVEDAAIGRRMQTRGGCFRKSTTRRSR